MRLNYLKLRNYRRFKSAELELPDGMVCVVGPNGAGKSTLLEAVAWVLYGNQAEIVRTDKESVKREGSAPSDPCSVEMEFSYGEQTYRIERSMKGKALTLSAAMHAGDKLMARGSDDVGKAVEGLFGMDHKSFFISIFARQKELNALSTHPKGERKKLVLRMLEIESIDEVVRRIREDLRLSKQGIESADSELRNESGKPVLDRLAHEQEGLAKKDKALEKEGKALNKELEKAEGVRAKLKKGLERMEAQRKKKESLEKEMAELDATVRTLGERLESIRRELKGLEKVETEVAGQREKRDKTKAEMTELERKRKAAQEEGRRARTKLGELTAERKQLAKEMEGLEKEIEAISELGPEGQCPTCKRKLGPTHQRLLKGFEGQRASAEKKYGNIEGYIAKHEEIIDDTTALLKALDRREEHLRGKLQAWELKLGKLERLPELRKGLADTESKIGKVRAARSRLEERLSALDFDEKAYAKHRAQAEELSDDIRGLERELSGVREQRARLEERQLALTERVERLRELEAAVAEKKARAELLGSLVSIMDQFKRHLISRIRPGLSSISSDLITQLTDSRYTEIELGEDYEISIRDAGRLHPIGRFSGGESDLANLCLRLAISEVIAEKHGTTGFNFVVLDEIFGSQDSQRKRALLSTLSGLGNRFKQIFLITHVEDVKELMGNVIQVRGLEDGTSVAEVGA